MLILTGRKEGLHDTIEEDDEDYLREHGGDCDILNRLSRVNIR